MVASVRSACDRVMSEPPKSTQHPLKQFRAHRVVVVERGRLVDRDQTVGRHVGDDHPSHTEWQLDPRGDLGRSTAGPVPSGEAVLMSRVDVVVPCYKYGHFLRECVESVLSQEGVDVRVLIIDDCSPDQTPEVAAELVQEDKRVEYRRHKVNHGHVDTYNEGLDWAAVVPGSHLLLGETVLLQVTRYTSPCTNITRAFKDGDYARVSQKRHPGWSRVYARVLAPGSIRPGDPVRLLDEVEAAAEVTAAASR